MADKFVTDELGLVKTNEFLTVVLPAYGALVFRVKTRTNRGYEKLPYGPLPLSSGDALPTYEGASATVPADGVLPARAYTTGLSFPLDGAYDETDMWYTTEDYRERLFHVIQKVTPAFLRVDVQIPKAVTQGRFQRDKVITGVDTDFGFARGELEVVHIPRLRYGFRYGNDTNLNVYTMVNFVYAEYIVEIPKDPNLIFDVLTRRVPSHWITLPVNVTDVSIDSALDKTYGFRGFPIYGINEKERAVREYAELLREALV